MQDNEILKTGKSIARAVISLPEAIPVSDNEIIAEKLKSILTKYCIGASMVTLMQSNKPKRKITINSVGCYELKRDHHFSWIKNSDAIKNNSADCLYAPNRSTNVISIDIVISNSMKPSNGIYASLTRASNEIANLLHINKTNIAVELL